MSNEVKQSLVIDRQTPVDKELRAVFYKLTTDSPAIYEQLTVPKEQNEQLKQDFFNSGRTIEPNLSATHLDEDELALMEFRWDSFKRELLESGVETHIAQAYRWAINEAIAGIRIAHYSAIGDMDRVRAYNKFIYGTPNPEIFDATTDLFRTDAEQYLNNEYDAVAQAAQAVINTVPNMGGDRQRLSPDDEIFALVKEMHFREGGYFALMLAGIDLPKGEKVPMEVGDPALRRVLRNIESDFDIQDSSGTVWSADSFRRALLRPANYNMVYNRFMGLAIGHEVRHILEGVNGERQSLQLFAQGLDRYEKGNEGRAVLGEQVVYDSFKKFSSLLRWQDIMRRHFAISLAEGLAGEEMSFSRVFEVVNNIDRLWERSKKPEDIVAADAKADKRTWDLMTRIMRGMDGQGGAYLKDITYLEGNLAVWAVAEQHPELIEAGDLGKFDISNPRHIAIAQHFKVIPVTN